MTTDTQAAPPQGQPADPAPATEAEQIKPAGQEEQTEQPKTEKPEEQPAKAESEEKQSRGVQKRLDELRRQAGDAQRMNERLLALMEKTLVKGESPRVEAPSGPPKRENFESYEDYLEARADYQVASRLKEIEQRAEQRKQQEVIERLEKTWEQRLSDAASKNESLEEYIETVGTKISGLAGVAIKEAEKGVEIVEFLGDNPAELRRISQLSPAAQVREIGKIEARLEVKEPVKKPSKAPPPIEPVGGSSKSGDPNAMSQAEYEAMRKKQGAWWAR